MTTKTTPEPFDPSGCPDMSDIKWLGNRVARLQYQSESARFFLLNILKKTATFDVSSNRDDFYTGFGILAKKNCGMNFLNALIAGKVRIDMYDHEAIYTVDPQRFLRDDKGDTHVTFAFGADQAEDKDAGNTKKDQIFMSITGLEDVEWGNKDPETCLGKMTVGVYNGLFDGDLGCVAWSKKVW